MDVWFVGFVGAWNVVWGLRMDEWAEWMGWMMVSLQRSSKEGMKKSVYNYVQSSSYNMYTYTIADFINKSILESTLYD